MISHKQTNWVASKTVPPPCHRSDRDDPSWRSGSFRKWCQNHDAKPTIFGWQYDETIHFEIQKVAGRNPAHNLPPTPTAGLAGWTIESLATMDSSKTLRVLKGWAMHYGTRNHCNSLVHFTKNNVWLNPIYKWQTSSIHIHKVPPKKKTTLHPYPLPHQPNF